MACGLGIRNINPNPNLNSNFLSLTLNLNLLLTENLQNMLGLELGQLFVMRNIANMVVNTDMSLLSGLTYAVDFLKVKVPLSFQTL